MNLLDDLKHLFILVYTNIDQGMPVHSSHSQVKVMRYLKQHHGEPITQKDIEQHLGLSRATVSGILKTMEKHDLIKREVHPMDTRLKTVELTPKASCRYEAAKEYFDTLQNQMIQGIDDQELSQFISTLHKISANLERKDDVNA